MKNKGYKITDADFARMRKVRAKENKYLAKDKHFYMSYTLRVVIMFVIVFLCALISYFCFSNCFTGGSRVSVDIQKEVEANSNVVTADSSLISDGKYNSENISNVEASFNYKVTSNKKVDYIYKYVLETVVTLSKKSDGTLVSQNIRGLKSSNRITTLDVDNIDISKNITIDYAYYNNLAKELSNKYHEDLDAKLEIVMRVYLDGNVQGSKNVIDSDTDVVIEMDLLSDNVVPKVTGNTSGGETFERVIKQDVVNNYLLYLGIILLIVGTIILLLTFNFIYKVRPKKSKYCTLRDGILRDYDRIIVTSRKPVALEKYNIIDCYNFRELLDAQRMLEKPIIYYEIVKNQKCMFMIIGDKDIYTYILKECDVDF